MAFEAVTDYQSYLRSARGGLGLVTVGGKVGDAQGRQRRKAADAYAAAFPLRPGQSYREWADACTRYGNYQVCLSRGYGHLVPQSAR